MFFKKDKPEELTEKEAKKLIGRIDVIQDWIRQTTSDLYLGDITLEEYNEKMDALRSEITAIEEIAKGERNEQNQKVFDELMGRPIEWLDEIFNNKVHEEIDAIDKERDEHNSETEIN